MKRVAAFTCSLLAAIAATALARADEGSAVGRAIYRGGDVAPSVTMRLAGATSVLPAATLPCANCHGLQGEGRVEGGLTVPAIGRDQLRGRYDVERFRSALSGGIAADGHPLLGMPRYDMSPAQLGALYAYVGVLGSEADGDPGVTSDTLTLGSVLPLSGGQARVGRVMADTLQRSIDAVNEQGGVYGRRLRLRLADGATDAGRAVDGLLAGEGVALLVASLGIEGSSGAAPRDRAGAVPVIAPLNVPSDAAASSAEPTYYTLPSLEDEVRGAARFLSERGVGSVLIVAGPVSSAAAAAFAAEQLGASATTVRTTQAAADHLRTRSPGGLLWLGSPSDLPGLLSSAGLERWAGVVVVPAYLVDPALRMQPSALRRRIHVVAPESSAEGDVPSMLARTAIAVTVAALQRCGRAVNRAVFAQALESAGSVRVGAEAPPLEFSTGKIGAHGTLIQSMSAEPLAGRPAASDRPIAPSTPSR